ncbi:hypothetical protein Pelo_1220 [Pelomyxa schiedti]|nr:hypothetical protein Pelo_1220 [Pelomyxa schiedti]
MFNKKQKGGSFRYRVTFVSAWGVPQSGGDPDYGVFVAWRRGDKVVNRGVIETKPVVQSTAAAATAALSAVLSPPPPVATATLPSVITGPGGSAAASASASGTTATSATSTTTSASTPGASGAQPQVNPAMVAAMVGMMHNKFGLIGVPHFAPPVTVVEFNENVTLVCTLFKTPQGWDRKNIELTLKEAKGKKKTALGTVKLDLSFFADITGVPVCVCLPIRRKKDSIFLLVKVTCDLMGTPATEEETEVLRTEVEDPEEDDESERVDFANYDANYDDTLACAPRELEQLAVLRKQTAVLGVERDQLRDYCRVVREEAIKMKREMERIIIVHKEEIATKEANHMDAMREQKEKYEQIHDQLKEQLKGMTEKNESQNALLEQKQQANECLEQKLADTQQCLEEKTLELQETEKENQIQLEAIRQEVANINQEKEKNQMEREKENTIWEEKEQENNKEKDQLNHRIAELEKELEHKKEELNEEKETNRIALEQQAASLNSEKQSALEQQEASLNTAKQSALDAEKQNALKQQETALSSAF